MSAPVREDTQLPPLLPWKCGECAQYAGPASALSRLPTRRAGAPTARFTPPRAAVAPIWLQRLSLFILVVFCIYLGVIVAVLPWWTSVWDHNLFLTSHPALWAVLRTRAARGVISGCGFLDIWIGISEAIQYRDQRN